MTFPPAHSPSDISVWLPIHIRNLTLTLTLTVNCYHYHIFNILVAASGGMSEMNWELPGQCPDHRLLISSAVDSTIG